MSTLSPEEEEELQRLEALEARQSISIMPATGANSVTPTSPQTLPPAPSNYVDAAQFFAHEYPTQEPPFISTVADKISDFTGAGTKTFLGALGAGTAYYYGKDNPIQPPTPEGSKEKPKEIPAKEARVGIARAGQEVTNAIDAQRQKNLQSLDEQAKVVSGAQNELSNKERAVKSTAAKLAEAGQQSMDDVLNPEKAKAYKTALENSKAAMSDYEESKNALNAAKQEEARIRNAPNDGLTGKVFDPVREKLQSFGIEPDDKAVNAKLEKGDFNGARLVLEGQVHKATEPRIKALKRVADFIRKNGPKSIPKSILNAGKWMGKSPKKIIGGSVGVGAGVTLLQAIVEQANTEYLPKEAITALRQEIDQLKRMAVQLRQPYGTPDNIYLDPSNQQSAEVINALTEIQSDPLKRTQLKDFEQAYSQVPQ